MGLLSLYKPATQSSTGWGGVASRAVDGSSDGHYGRHSCTHSAKKANNWWQVNLLGTYPVHLVVVHNRWDCCHNRIDKAEVSATKL